VPEAAGPSAGVGAQVSDEESCRAQFTPLPHVDELVRDEGVVLLVTSSEEDPSAQGHPGDPGCEDRHDNDACSLGIVRGNVIERSPLARVQTSRHGVSR
jgi:hypothetical protein